MLRRLADWVGDRILGWCADLLHQRAETPPLDWKTLREEIRADLEGYSLFLQVRDGPLHPIDTAGLEARDIVALAAAWREGKFGSSEQHAHQLAERLSKRPGISAYVQIDRGSPSPGVTYYVKVSRESTAVEHVIYNGRRVRAEWPARVERAQEQREYLIGGLVYPRIRYGDEQYAKESGGPVSESCHDCATLPGQYHVGPLCDMEECPRCHGQVIGCDCPYEGDVH